MQCISSDSFANTFKVEEGDKYCINLDSDKKKLSIYQTLLSDWIARFGMEGTTSASMIIGSKLHFKRYVNSVPGETFYWTVTVY